MTTTVTTSSTKAVSIKEEVRLYSHRPMPVSRHLVQALQRKLGTERAAILIRDAATGGYASRRALEIHVEGLEVKPKGPARGMDIVLRMGPEAVWRNDSLIIDQEIPATMLAHLPGAALGQVVDMPDADDLKILEISSEGGRTIIRVLSEKIDARRIDVGTAAAMLGPARRGYQSWYDMWFSRENRREPRMSDILVEAMLAFFIIVPWIIAVMLTDARAGRATAIISGCMCSLAAIPMGCGAIGSLGLTTRRVLELHRKRSSKGAGAGGS